MINERWKSYRESKQQQGWMEGNDDGGGGMDAQVYGTQAAGLELDEWAGLEAAGGAVLVGLSRTREVLWLRSSGVPCVFPTRCCSDCTCGAPRVLCTSSMYR